MTWFGAGAAFFSSCRKAGLNVGDAGDLSAIRALGSTGSPLSEEVQRWGTAQVLAAGSPAVWWYNISGGTDFCGAFVGGNYVGYEMAIELQNHTGTLTHANFNLIV